MRHALTAEWTKLRTLPSNVWMMIALVGAMTAGAAIVIAATDVPGCRGEYGGCPARDATALILMGVHAAQIAVVALASAAICSEFQPRLIRATLAMNPRRHTVFTAKVLVACGAVLVTATAGTVLAVLAGLPALTSKGLTADLGYAQPALTAGPLHRAVLGTVLYLTVVAVLSAGIAAAIRHIGASIGFTLTALYGPYMITVLIPMSPQTLHRIQDASPMMAGLTIQTTIAGTGTSTLAPWTGLAVLAAYAVGALIIGGTLFTVRDA